MDANFVLAISGGRFNIFFSKYSSETNCDDSCFTIDFGDSGAIHVDCECGYGWSNGFVDTGRNNELFGGDWELYLDFYHKLPCQYSGA